VFACPPGRGLVSLLTKDHIFGSKATHFDEELAGGAALRAPIKEPAVSSASPLLTSRRRPYIFFASFFDSPVFASATFWSIPLRVRDILVVLCRHVLISFSGFLDETSET